MTFAEITSIAKTVKSNVQAQPAPHTSKSRAEQFQVRVLCKNHYGKEHYYPANGNAELFCKIQGGKTLTADTLRALKAAGYTIQYRYEEPAF